MSAVHRSFGVSFFAILFVLGSLLSILLWGFPTVFCLTHPEKFIAVFQYVLSGKYFRSLYFLYENTFAFAYLFVGFALWRLKPWAYRLLLVLLLIELVEKMAFVTWLLGTHRIPLSMVGREGGIQISILFLLLLFFRRKTIREQFTEGVSLGIPSPDSEKPTAASVGEMVSTGQTTDNQPNLWQVLLRRRQDQEQSRDELVWLHGIEIVCVCLLILGGAYVGWRQKMSVPEFALYGSLWAVESYLVCFYLFRARKLSMVVGGVISVVAATLLHLPMDDFEKVPALSLTVNLVSILSGGFVGGRLARVNSWFHGSSAGMVWAVFQIAGRLHQKYGLGLADWEKLNLAFAGSSFLTVLTMGLLVAGMGGFLAQIFSRSEAEKNP